LLGYRANRAPFLTCRKLLEKMGTPRFHDCFSTSGKIVASSTVVASCGSQREAWPDGTHASSARVSNAD